jgi:hypothetical protein
LLGDGVTAPTFTDDSTIYTPVPVKTIASQVGDFITQNPVTSVVIALLILGLGVWGWNEYSDDSKKKSKRKR